MDEDLERKIRDRAHRLWESEGYPDGRADEHWHEARRQVMAEEGLGEPGDGGEVAPDRPYDDMPEPQPEIPADPLRNPGEADPVRDAIYPTGPGPEMPADADPGPEIPYESGISEIPAPGPGDGDAERGPGGGIAAAGTAKTAAANAPRKRGGGGGSGGRSSPGKPPKDAIDAAEDLVPTKPRSGRSGRAKAGQAAT